MSRSRKRDTSADGNVSDATRYWDCADFSDAGQDVLCGCLSLPTGHCLSWYGPETVVSCSVVPEPSLSAMLFAAGELAPCVTFP